MATRTINPQSNPYGGGAVVFDSTPYVEYYLREQQKEDAKNEALDRYYQEEMSKVSPAGMRSEDLPIFTQKFNELKNLWVKDKEAIKNPSKYGFDKAQQYNQLKADLMSLPLESKEEKEKEATVLKLLADPAKRELIDIPTLSEAMQIQKMPIRTEGRKSIDLANLPFVAKEMTPQEKATYVKSVLGLAGKDVQFGEPTKLGGYQQKVTYTTQYSDENLKKLGDIARKDALTNKNLARTAKLDFERITPEMKLELDALHKQLYGRPIQGAEDLAAASIIQAGKLAKEEEAKREEDKAAIQAAKNARAAASKAERETKKNNTTDFVLRMKDAVESGTAQDVADIGMELLAGGGGGTNKEFVRIKVNNNDKGFTIEYKEKEGGTVFDEIKRESFDPKKPESYLRLARLFQDITGSSAALEKNIFTGKGNYVGGSQKPQQSQQPQPINNNGVKFDVDGTEYVIPQDKVAAFLKAKPNAKKKADSKPIVQSIKEKVTNVFSPSKQKAEQKPIVQKAKEVVPDKPIAITNQNVVVPKVEPKKPTIIEAKTEVSKPMATLNKPKSDDVEFDEAIDWITDYEHTNSSSVGNYHGGGSNWGTNNKSIKTKEEAKKYYKEKYYPKVKDLPSGLRTRALQLAINTGDPYGVIMVASGKMTNEERIATKNERKDKDIRGNSKWESVKDEILREYSSDPEGFLSKLDNEQFRYYNKGLNDGKNPQDIKDFHNNYFKGVGQIAKKYIKK